MKFIPNILTIFRFFLVPVFVWVFFNGDPIIALAIFVLACLTDILDGFLARRMKVVSDFGKWADPAADKLMTIVVLSCLVKDGNLPWYFLAFYFSKELLLSIGVSVTYFKKQKGKIHQAKPIGKLAMTTTFIGLSSSFFSDLIDPWNIAIMWMAVGMSIAATMYYYLYYYKTKTPS